MRYLGSFSLPPGRQEHDPNLPSALASRAKFGYGGRAMCLGASPGRLWVSGNRQANLVAGVQIPAIGETAELQVPFFEVTPRDKVIEADLDQLVGLASHRQELYALWQDGYDVDGKDGGRQSLWNGKELAQVGPGRLMQHAGYMTAHDGAIWCGRSHGAGNASIRRGPVLYRLEGSQLIPFSIPERDDWTPADRYTGLVFLPGEVCWLVSKAVGTIWYGMPVGPDGKEDLWNQNKGYHTDQREVRLLQYTWPELKPIGHWKLPQYHTSAKCGGVAYDEQARRLYVHELWPPEKAGNTYPWERPRVHVYEITEPNPDPEPEPERDKISVDVLIDGDRYAGDLERADD